jgi:hypothetical protein
VNPLPFIVASYALAALVVGWLCIDAVLRLRTARRRLAAAEGARARP